MVSRVWVGYSCPDRGQAGCLAGSPFVSAVSCQVCRGVPGTRAVDEGVGLGTGITESHCGGRRSGSRAAQASRGNGWAAMTRGPYPGPVTPPPLLPGALRARLRSSFRLTDRKPDPKHAPSRLRKVGNAVGERPPGALPRDQMIMMPSIGLLSGRMLFMVRSFAHIGMIGGIQGRRISASRIVFRTSTPCSAAAL